VGFRILREAGSFVPSPAKGLMSDLSASQFDRRDIEHFGPLDSRACGGAVGP
jgi:hypothetical protein